MGDDGRTAASGSFEPSDIPTGGLKSIGHLDLPLTDLPAPAHYKLIVRLEKSAFENDWDLWVYPRATAVVAPASISLLIVNELNAATREKLELGGDVLLMIPPVHVARDPQKGKVALGFSSIFWNTAWTNGQAPHTLGILCDPRHPALATFPTEAYSNWQWWYPVSHATAMILDGLPAELHPIVQVVDDWVTNRKLGLVFEARVGKGRLLVTSIDLNGHAMDPVRRQLRASLIAYATGDHFDPKVSLTVGQIESLMMTKR